MANPVEAASARDGFAVTKSDSTVIRFDALYVGGTGDVTVRTSRGATLTFEDVPVGTILPISGDRVMAATTATLIVGLVY